MYKKDVIHYCIIILLSILFVTCISKNTNDHNSYKDEIELKSRKLCKEDFDFLEIGMTIKEVTDVVGEPDAPAGSGVVMIKYELCDNSAIILNFGPYGQALKTVLFEDTDGILKVVLE